MIKLRTENAELKMLYAVNTIQAMVEGGDGKALEKSSTWPTDINERAVAGAECNTVIELKLEHHAA